MPAQLEEATEMKVSEVMQQTYKTGDKVPTSGIYKVVHDSNHTAEHEVTCVSDEHFPPCNGCGPHPRFKLVRAAHHVEKHEAFKK